MEPSRKPETKKGRRLRPIGSLTSKTAVLPARKDSTPPESTNLRQNTEIIGLASPANVGSNATGLQRGVTVFGIALPTSESEVQALLAKAKPGQVDEAIPAWLPRSVSCRIRERRYQPRVDGPSDPQRNFELLGYELDDGFDEDDGRESLRLLEMLNARAVLKDCQNELARLKMLTAARTTGQDDLVAQIAIYAEELTEYSIDVVRDACRAWAKHERWFPAWADLRTACEERVMKRRAILSGLRRYFG